MKEFFSPKTKNMTVPAIVIGSSITTLGVLRSLGAENIPSIFISNDNSYITYSRYCRKKVITSEDLSNPERLGNLLKKLNVQRAVLFPCSDALVLSVASLHKDLKERFISSHADIGLIEKLLDKAELAKILAKFKLPHPKTLVIENKDDLKKVESAEFNNIFLKPRASFKFFKHYGVKAIQVKNRQDAISKAQEIHNAGFSLVLQEYIPGPKSNHYFVDGFVDRFGDVKTLFARNRIRMFPPDFGNSSYMYSVSLNSVKGAAKTLYTLFDKINYRGIFSTEFKYDERDGLYKVIEINVRPWWYTEFATCCGVNVCKMAYEDALNRNVDNITDYDIGTSLVYFYYDLLSCLQLYRTGKLTIRSWLGSWWRATHPIFRMNDALPAMIKSLYWLKAFAKRRLTQ